MIIGMILETLSVSMVIPTISYLTNQGEGQNFIFGKLNFFLPGYRKDQYFTLIILLLVGVYFIKAIYFSFLAWFQTGLAYGIQRSTSLRLFTTYLRQPYSFHLKKNSSELLQNVITEVNLFVGNVINPLIDLMTELFVVLGISLFLFIYEPIGSLVTLCVITFTTANFYWMIKKRTSYYGILRQFHERSRLQHLQQGLGGVKDVKLLGREIDFLSQYEYHNRQSTRMLRIAKALSQFPRFWIEFLAIFGLSLMMFVVSYNGADKSTLLPIISLFGAAGFRLIPSFNRILNSLQSYRFGSPVIDTLHHELYQNEHNSPKLYDNCVNFTFNEKIEISGLTFIYPDTNKKILDNISFSIQIGQTIGIIGPSGSGKSTLVDLILGLFLPTAGSIKVDNFNIADSMRKWQNLIGYVPQSVFLCDDTLRRNIAFGIPDKDIDDVAINTAIKYAHLEDYVNSLDLGVNTFVGERGIRISGGQRQRIGIARALYHNPTILVLDEATSSLDNDTEREVMDSIIALKGAKTIIIVAHRLTTVKHCNMIIRIEKGKLIQQGTPLEVL
jgi:ABC-type multidrug transport system fused ATPase/permease subunit